MSYKNYKKSKLGKLRSFCAVVENKDSILKASEAIMISSSSVSKDISSLEKDLGYKLFDRIKNKLLINKNGQEYYKIAKNIILDLEQAYSRGLDNVDKSEISKILRKKKIEIINKKLDNWKIDINKILNKMLVRITWKKVISFFAICILGCIYYLYRVDYFFERKLYKMGSPLTQEVVTNGHYRVDKNIPCAKDQTLFCIDIGKIVLYLLEKKYSIKVTLIKMTEFPSAPMRLNGDDKIAEKFNNDNEISCDRANRFLWMKERSKTKFKILNESKNSKFYILYQKSTGINHKIFLQNVKKYPNQIFDIKISEREPISKGTYWIINHNGYYYMFYETNAVQQHEQHKASERYLIFKKLTFEQLKTFDKGSYWKLIKEYNIKID